MKIKINKDLLKDIEKINKEASVWNENPKNTLSKPDVMVMSKKLWYIRILYLISNPIVYIFTGKWNW